MIIMEHHLELDVRHEDSPVPTIRTKETLDTMDVGSVLKVITSKESTIKNIRTLVANNPYELIHHSKEKTDFIFLIKKLK
jgi:TusA-related sulfurtransferase